MPLLGSFTSSDDMFVNRGNIATAYLSHSNLLLSKIAELLGRDREAEHYRAIADATCAAWQRACALTDGPAPTVKTTTSAPSPSTWFRESSRKRVVERLVTLIEQADDHLGAGFLSTPMILPVLALHGRADVAYRLLLQTSSPSWLAGINTSTAIRENWDEFTAKGDRRGSSNHCAFGSVANWMITGIVGINPAAPGYQRVLFHPHIRGGLTHATATVPTPFGTVGASWRITDSTVTYTVELHLGTTGAVVSPDGTTHEVGSGAHKIQWTNP